ncbi:MAG: hypothetical protein R3B90_23005 [Planctomycetaceae bacterium]
MGLFSRKDWNIIAIIFQRGDLYTVSGQRVKGGDATKARDGAEDTPAPSFGAIFDQSGKLLESGTGPGHIQASPDAVKKLERELPMTKTVQETLKALESGAADKIAKPLIWNGYPKK